VLQYNLNIDAKEVHLSLLEVQQMTRKRRGTAVKVKGYSYMRKGKRIRVTGYSRKRARK